MENTPPTICERKIIMWFLIEIVVLIALYEGIFSFRKTNPKVDAGMEVGFVLAGLFIIHLAMYFAKMLLILLPIIFVVAFLAKKKFLK